jgi:hypothetical protein
MLALLAAAGPMAGASRADTFSVTGTTWGSATTAGTLAWAIDQANASSATGNVISIAPNLLIDVDDATAIDVAYNLAQFTRSVTIQGNGATLVGNPDFVTSGGTVTKYNPDRFVSGDIPGTPSFSFAKIGTFGLDNSAITVAITGLNADGLNRFALIEPGARLDVTTAGIVNSVNFDFSGRNITPGFEALAGERREGKGRDTARTRSLAGRGGGRGSQGRAGGRQGGSRGGKSKYTVGQVYGLVHWTSLQPTSNATNK